MGSTSLLLCTEIVETTNNFCQFSFLEKKGLSVTYRGLECICTHSSSNLSCTSWSGSGGTKHCITWSKDGERFKVQSQVTNTCNIFYNQERDEKINVCQCTVLFYCSSCPPLTANSDYTTIVLYNYDHFSYPICVRIVKLYLVVFRKNMNIFFFFFRKFISL